MFTLLPLTPLIDYRISGSSLNESYTYSPSWEGGAGYARLVMQKCQLCFVPCLFQQTLIISIVDFCQNSGGLSQATLLIERRMTIMWCVGKKKVGPILNDRTHCQSGKQYVVVSRFILWIKYWTRKMHNCHSEVREVVSANYCLQWQRDLQWGTS